MSIIPLTLAVSLCLVFTFVIFFIREQARRPFGGGERESLLPLADETPRPVRRAGAPASLRGDGSDARNAA